MAVTQTTVVSQGNIANGCFWARGESLIEPLLVLLNARPRVHEYATARTILVIMPEGPDGYVHVRRNMVIEPARHESISVASDFTDSEAVEAEGPLEPPVYRFNGYFCFRLDNPPIVPWTR
jgi:hypothetical protein